MGTVRDVAKRANVSISTVSHVLNGTAPIKEETKRQVEEAIRFLNYQHKTRQKKTTQKELIGILADDISSPFVPSMIKGILTVANKSGYDITIREIAMESDLELNQFNSKNVDGIVLTSSWTPNFLKLNSLTVPIVLCHRESNNLPIPTIMPSDFQGGYVATRHLLENNWVPVIHIGGPLEWMAGRERKNGYLYAMKERGLPPNSQWVKHADTWETSSGYQIMSQILEQIRPPFGLFCANDLLAIGAINALRENGYRVPEDVGVVGFDNRGICELFYPKLTTVQLPSYNMGEAAANVLLDIIRGKKRNETALFIECPLIIRESSSAYSGHYKT